MSKYFAKTFINSRSSYTAYREELLRQLSDKNPPQFLLPPTTIHHQQDSVVVNVVTDLCKSSLASLSTFLIKMHHCCSAVCAWRGKRFRTEKGFRNTQELLAFGGREEVFGASCITYVLNVSSQPLNPVLPFPPHMQGARVAAVVERKSGIRKREAWKSR